MDQPFSLIRLNLGPTHRKILLSRLKGLPFSFVYSRFCICWHFYSLHAYLHFAGFLTCGSRTNVLAFLPWVNSDTLQLLLTFFFRLFKILYLMRFLFLLCLITLCLVSNLWILNQCSCISTFSELGYFTIPSNYFALSVFLIPTFILSILDFVSNEISILIIPIYTFLDYQLVDLQQILQNCPCFSALLPPIISLRLLWILYVVRFIHLQYKCFFSCEII